eukprot:8462948-Pyramimonas_sp.AAC.1
MLLAVPRGADAPLGAALVLAPSPPAVRDAVRQHARAQGPTLGAALDLADHVCSAVQVAVRVPALHKLVAALVLAPLASAVARAEVRRGASRRLGAALALAAPAAAVRLAVRVGHAYRGLGAVVPLAALPAPVRDAVRRFAFGGLGATLVQTTPAPA